MRPYHRSLARLLPALLLVPLLGLGPCRAALADSSSGALPLDELRLFTEVYAKIKKDYVEPISDKTLLESAIRGMVNGLDPHSAYLDPDQYKNLQAGTTGEFGGLGIEVGLEDGFIRVISPIDGTPAARAGVKPGDIIVRLNETPVKGMSLGDAVKMMRGKPGSKIELTIVREGAAKPLKITLTRAIIKVTSVHSKLYPDGLGYVRISQFQSRTGENLRQAVAKLIKENKGKLKGLVLDLRNNPGGVLGAAVSVSDAFLNSGRIVYTKGRLPQARLSFSAKPGDIIDGAPMVVLINGGSASASEIVSGALQDHHRAIIVGQRSFGKGSVQTIFPMEGGAALKLTTARYYTPSGRSIQGEGIIPDIPVQPLKIASVEQGTRDMVKEADLARHLVGQAEKALGEKAQLNARHDVEVLDKLARTDYTLYEGLNVLRGLAIYHSDMRGG